MEKSLEIEISRENGHGHFYARLRLPAEEYEMRDAFQRLRLGADYDAALDISVKSCPALPALTGERLDSPTMNELNFFAKRLNALNEDEILVLRAVAQKFFAEEKELVGMKDLINLTYGLDEVSIISFVRSDKELGQFVIDNDLHDDVSAVPDGSLYLLDLAKIGALQRKIDGGVFIDGKYVITAEYELKDVYCGRELPQSDISTNYAFRLKIAKPSAGGVSKAEWISLPIDRSEADQIARNLGVSGIEDCVSLEFESTVPQITEASFEGMRNFDKLNDLGAKISKLMMFEQAKFKAALEAESPTTMDEILDIAKNLHRYEFDLAAGDAGEFFKRYAAQFFRTQFDPEWLETLNTNQEGWELLDRLGAYETSYGILSARDRSLYAPVSKWNNRLFESDTLERIEVLGNPALFTNERISRRDVPEGLYRYDVRHDDEGRLCAVEANVAVNHGGTILVKSPLDLGEEGCRLFDDETAPNFLGERMTVKEFMETDFSQAETDGEQTMQGGL